jgi:REP element-mobilizing transposase RayT
MSTIKLLTHIVFATKRRKMTINEDNCYDLYRFIAAYLKKNDCYLKRVNGIGNHIHILVDLHPSISVATLVQHLKRDTSIWMSHSGLFPYWEGWCEGYFACSVSPKYQEAVIEYIKSQKIHHLEVPMEDEYLALLKSAGVEYDGYMMK